MFNLQVTLSDFRSRKRQFISFEPLIVLLRFGSIKLDIKLNSNREQLLGGKRIILDLTAQELKNMFQCYALGMFIENQQGRFFSILSLQKLQFTDIVSSQQIYFFNDNQEIIYSTNFSMIFNDFKNPRMPNQQKIENYKTFNQFFKKPAIPTSFVGAKTLSSFLYGNKAENPVKQKMSSSKNLSRQQPSSAQSKNKNQVTPCQRITKKKKIKQFLATQQKFQICKDLNGSEGVDDNNPPVMEFTNTQENPSKGLNSLKTQIAQLNLTAPQSFKLMAAYNSNNEFIKTEPKDTRNAIIKIQENVKNSQNIVSKTTNFLKDNTNESKVNRDELRNKAKKEMQTYQGNISIKIPVLKDGKYELVELAQLNEQEIASFAKKQKQMELEQEKKKEVQRELEKRQKQNSLLKKQLEEKQRQLARQEEQAKKQKLQLLKAKQFELAEQKKKLALVSKASEPQRNSQESYQDSDEEKNEFQNASQKDSDIQKNQDEDQNHYESDFQSMSMASAKKKSQLSQKKQDESESYNDYNQSYDPDFQSYSQSLLGSQQRLSMSQISQSLRSVSPKRK